MNVPCCVTLNVFDICHKRLLHVKYSCTIIWPKCSAGMELDELHHTHGIYALQTKYSVYKILYFLEFFQALNSYSASCDNWCTVGGDGRCRVGKVQAGTTSPMPDHKGLKLQELVNFQKFSTLRVKTKDRFSDYISLNYSRLSNGSN